MTEERPHLRESDFPYQYVVSASLLREPRWRQTFLATFAGFGLGGLVGQPWLGFLPALVGTASAVRSYVPRLPGKVALRAEAGTLDERYCMVRGRVVACADDALPPAARFFSSRGMRTCSQPFAVETETGGLLLVATRYLELGPMTPHTESFADRADYCLPAQTSVSVVFEHERQVPAPPWVGAARGLSSYRGTSTKVTQVSGRTTSLIILSTDYAPVHTSGAA